MARALLAEEDVQHTLQKICDLAVETIDGCELAGVFVVANGRVATPASTEPLVIELDALQLDMSNLRLQVDRERTAAADTRAEFDDAAKEQEDKAGSNSGGSALRFIFGLVVVLLILTTLAMIVGEPIQAVLIQFQAAVERPVVAQEGTLDLDPEVVGPEGGEQADDRQDGHEPATEEARLQPHEEQEGDEHPECVTLAAQRLERAPGTGKSRGDQVGMRAPVAKRRRLRQPAHPRVDRVRRRQS